LNESNYQKDSISVLRELFLDHNRAEWSLEHFKELFVEPTYLTKLEASRPCFLVGGRGTGKTTSLQSLHYQSTLERLESEGMGFSEQRYLGIHIRLNKNRVRAFQGGQIDQDTWSKIFAHYVNLLVCLELAKLSSWLEQKAFKKITSESLANICRDIGIEVVGDCESLESAIKSAISILQLYVNVPNQHCPILSMAEAPLRTFVEELENCDLLDEKVVFCCFDEYENLLDYQQAVINTYIKHAEPPLSYKVGVRKNGLRNRQTTDSHDLLQTPDDFAEIEIADEGFEYFAKAVAELRLKRARAKGVNVPETLADLLNDLSFAEEATLLGADKIADDVLQELKHLDEGVFEYFSTLPKSEVYFLKYWHEGSGASILNLAKDWIDNEPEWKTRFGNHSYASLFWISKGRKGARIRKYYCGERTLLALPAGNIRFFLELIDAAISHELDTNSEFSIEKNFSISPASQTKAARDVGQSKLNQLEGLADHGVQLKRLILGIGKVFFEMARSPAGKTPEVTSFVLTGEPVAIEKMKELLAEGVGNLAIETTARTKATSSNELKDEEYRLHPIYYAFFEISHRRKRRTTFDAGTLLKLITKTAPAISELLNHETQSVPEDLPTQLAFFSAFYEGGE
jgi:hypothetical protein